MRGGAVLWTVRRGATGSRRGVAVKAAATAARSAKREHISEHNVIVDDNVNSIDDIVDDQRTQQEGRHDVEGTNPLEHADGHHGPMGAIRRCREIALRLVQPEKA